MSREKPSLYNTGFLSNKLWLLCIYPAITLLTISFFHQLLAREYHFISLVDAIELANTRGWRNLIGASFLASITLPCFHILRLGGKRKIYAATILSSIALVLFLYQTGLVMFESWAEFKPIPLLYVDYLAGYVDENWKFIVCELIALSPLGLIITHWVMKHDLQSHPFGNAHFASALEIAKGDFLEKEQESIIVGKKFGQPIFSNGFEHILCFAPTGSGKTTSIGIPNLFHYPYSIVVSDIKLSMYKTTSKYREEHLGHKCYVWAPASSDLKTHRFNPFDLISDDKVKRISEIQKIAHIFIPDGKGDGKFWARNSRCLFQALLLYMIDTRDRIVSLGEMGRLLKRPDFFGWLTLEVEHTTHHDPNFYSNASAYLNNDEKTLKNIYVDFCSYFELFDDPIIDAATSASDFDLRSLRKEKITIYVGFTDDDKERLSPILSLFWQQLISVMIQNIPSKNEEPYPLFCLIDEFASLGRIDRLRRSLKLLREYRVRCLLMMQYLDQTLENYNQSEAKAFTNIKTKIAFSTDSFEDAQYISKLLGYKTKKVYAGSHSYQERGGSHTKSYSYQQVPLMRPEEVMRMKVGNTLILRTGYSPIKAKQFRWYKDRLMKRMAVGKIELPIQTITQKQVKNIEHGEITEEI